MKYESSLELGMLGMLCFISEVLRDPFIQESKEAVKQHYYSCFDVPAFRTLLSCRPRETSRVDGYSSDLRICGKSEIQTRALFWMNLR